MAQDEFGFDTRVINVLQKKDEFINGTERTFFNSLSGVEQQLFNAIWIEAQKVNQDSGKILFDESNIDSVNKIEKLIADELKKSSYPKDVETFLRSFENIKRYNLQANESVNELDPKEVEALVNPVQKAVVAQTLEGLTGSGLNANFIQPVKEGIFKNVVAGSTMADLEKTLRQLIISGAVDSKLKRYVTQVSRDALNQFDGQVNSAIANEFGLDAYRYVGSLIEDSRPQCIRWAGKQVLLKEDLQKEISWATSNGTGMIAGTTPENFATFRGGYNCRHSAIPFKLTASQRAKLQQEAPEKEAQIEVQQAQAKAAKEQEKVKQQEAKVEAAKEQVKEAKVVAKEEAKKAALYKDIKVEQINESNDPDEQYILSKEEQDYYLKISGVPEDAKGTAKMRFNTTLDDSDKRVIRIITVDYEGGGYDFGRAGGKDQGEKMMRTFYPITKIAHNDYFRIQDNSKYKGKGAQIFANQVAALTNENYKFIETQAARGSGNVFNGYYTWARLGYEPSPSKVEKVLSKFNLLNAFNTEAPKVKTWGELLGTKYGQKWWKENGDTFEGTFDLTPNSYSQTTLKNYLESKGKPQQTAKEIEAIRKAEEKARKQAEAEARRKAKEEERKRKEEERKRKAEEAARKKAEAEAKRKAKEEERKRKEEEKARKAEEKKRKEEEAARKKAEAQAAKEAQKKKPASFTLKNQEEVDAFTKDSVFKQDFYHATTVANAESIIKTGFKTDTTTVGKYFGNGAYLTDQIQVADRYNDIISNKGFETKIVAFKVNVKNPLVYDQNEIDQIIARNPNMRARDAQEAYLQKFYKQHPKLEELSEKYRKEIDAIHSEKFQEYQRLLGVDKDKAEKFFEENVKNVPNAFYGGISKAAKELGFDSLYFKQDKWDVQGGQQLVVFDANNIRSIEKKTENIERPKSIEQLLKQNKVEGEFDYKNPDKYFSEAERKKVYIKYLKEKDPNIEKEYPDLNRLSLEIIDSIMDEKNVSFTQQGLFTRMLNKEGKPLLVSKDEFEKLKNSQEYIVIKRGLVDSGSKTAQDMIKQFKEENLFDGYGIFGNGTYFDRGTGVNYDAAIAYAENKKENVFEALLPRDAKIISNQNAAKLFNYYDMKFKNAALNVTPNDVEAADLERERQFLFDKGILDAEKENFLISTIDKFKNTSSRDRYKYQIEDQGALLTAFGYDAVWIEHQNPNETMWKYLNLLNRTGVITTKYNDN